MRLKGKNEPLSNLVKTASCTDKNATDVSVGFPLSAIYVPSMSCPIAQPDTVMSHGLLAMTNGLTKAFGGGTATSHDLSTMPHELTRTFRNGRPKPFSATSALLSPKVLAALHL